MPFPATRERANNAAGRTPPLGRQGAVLVEFAAILPFLVIAILGLSDLGTLLEKKVTMIHIAREAAAAYSRGSTAQETINAVLDADDGLDLDGPDGKIILTEVTLNADGDPVIVAQVETGGLAVDSELGTLPPGADEAPATIPNGQELPPDMTLYAVEVFSQRALPFGVAWSERSVVTLRSLAAF